MAYFLNLFSPDTWEAFRAYGATVSGFPFRQRNMAAQHVHKNDIFLCYITGVSRWCGALEVISKAYEDSTPIYEDPDPFVVRFKVKPLIILDKEVAISTVEDRIWSRLSFLRDKQKGGRGGWSTFFQRSLRPIMPEDGNFLMDVLQRQDKERVSFPFTEKDKKRLRRSNRKSKAESPKSSQKSPPLPVRVKDGNVPSLQTKIEPPLTAEVRCSIQMQGHLAKIGAAMGFDIWIPRSDRRRVMECVPLAHHRAFLEVLPFSYDSKTMKTIENIDVLWVRGRAMARDFEVEETTAIYSGLLRMADLLALQPNMDIPLYIVASNDRREKVFAEIKRPVFAQLHKPLTQVCSFLSYDCVEKIAGKEDLSDTRDTILDRYAKSAHA